MHVPCIIHDTDVVGCGDDYDDDNAADDDDDH